jgi:hypothetical protein
LKRRRTPRILFSFISIAYVLTGCSDNPSEPRLTTTRLTDITLVDTLARVNSGFPLAFDSQGEPHLAYLRRDPAAESGAYARQIIYSRRVAGEWQKEIVVRNGDFLDGLNLGLEKSQQPFVMYQRILGPCAANLQIATRAPNGYWSEAVIDSDGYPGWYTSVQTLPSGDVRVAYSAGCPYYNLRYAERLAGEWSTMTVESDENSGYFPTLASTEEGEPLIVSLQLYVGLRLTQRSNGAWHTSTLVPDGLSPQLVTDESFLLHLLYSEKTLGGDNILKYAVRTPSGTWHHELVAHEVVSEPSVALDSNGNLWFVYRHYEDQEHQNFMIGEGSGGIWSIKELPEAGAVENVTINRTFDGRLGVAYITTSSKLYFAWVQP